VRGSSERARGEREQREGMQREGGRWRRENPHDAWGGGTLGAEAHSCALGERASALGNGDGLGTSVQKKSSGEQEAKLTSE
jgi:hypothetical protein